ncbi:MAG: hypothetical protein J0I45_17615 [Bosea sp.]|nr:hypothetical protein [Bosea sp. (in: a-proteobacteria)]
MAQMLVRNIDDAVAERFKQRAKADGKSAEQVLRELIDRYAARPVEERLAALDAIRATTIGKPVVDPVAIIRQDRDTGHGRY